MTPVCRRVLPVMVAAVAIGCADEPFGPTLTERWGGEGAELDAVQSPPTLRMACGAVVRFRAAIPLTSNGAFTVEADEEGPVFHGPSVTVSGQIVQPDLVLSLLSVAAPAGTPSQQFLLHRGRAGDFPTDIVCAD